MSNAAPTPVLLDTCAIIDLAEGRLPAQVVVQLTVGALAGGVFVSSVSAWEIGLLNRKNRQGLTFLPDPTTWFARIVAPAGIRLVTLTPEVAIASSDLPGPLHADPADRLLIATARDLRVPLVTSDRKIIDYGAGGQVSVIAY